MSSSVYFFKRNSTIAILFAVLLCCSILTVSSHAATTKSHKSSSKNTTHTASAKKTSHTVIAKTIAKPKMTEVAKPVDEVATTDDVATDSSDSSEIKSLVNVHKVGFLWPVEGEIRSGFGYRKHPMGGGTRLHRGIDIAAPKGTIIYASKSGEVVHADWYGLMGNCVILKNDNEFSTYYAHCSKILVQEGDFVTKGQPIAMVGSTGLSTGPHLHFEIRQNGVPINPLKYVHQE